METECPVCGRESGSYKGYAIHFGNSHEGNPLLALIGRHKLASLYEEMSEKAVAEELGVGRRTVERALRAAGINRRGQSEAEQLKNEQMSEEERRNQTKNARESHFEKYGDGGHIQEWDEENPEEHREVARRAAPLGAPAREQNGMAGITGQDHPNWRGGKSVYDAVKKQLRPAFGTVRDNYRDEECAMCGATASISGRKLDVHHIVPVLCGGTNEGWNFITLCVSCHHRAEWWTRDFLDPVLID